MLFGCLQCVYLLLETEDSVLQFSVHLFVLVCGFAQTIRERIEISSNLLLFLDLFSLEILSEVIEFLGELVGGRSGRGHV